jgi:hypothetical protein
LFTLADFVLRPSRPPLQQHRWESWRWLTTRAGHMMCTSRDSPIRLSGKRSLMQISVFGSSSMPIGMNRSSYARSTWPLTWSLSIGKVWGHSISRLSMRP